MSNDVGSWSSSTNSQKDSVYKANVTCSQFWELQQHKALLKMAIKSENNYSIVRSAEARAKRTAAIYARLFLEKEHKSNPKLRGRYYWMGFGAFAAKTVAYIISHPTDMVSPLNNLFRQGNFWLFMEIAPWHFAWNENPETFETCLTARDVDKFQNFKPVMKNLKWADESLKILKNLKWTSQIRDAFGLLHDIELVLKGKQDTGYKFNKVKDKLMKHLKYIAVQEQWNVLQPLVWNKCLAKTGVGLGKAGELIAIAPEQTLVFTSDYTSDAVRLHRKYINGKPTAQYEYRNPKHKKTLEEIGTDKRFYEDAPLTTIASNYNSRMEWINEAAKTYHDLMLDDKARAFLYKELAIIGSWANAT